ncbi:hypothetical protein ACFVTE_14000 [Arthrobacter sp. NPDC058097]|uniref:hypothetical protein n=1 Tax=Arthrobacter sp. NPDC058097 TaxID=3346340 RepID=UPI0036DA7A8B
MSNYVVRALKFTCVADTGPDWGGTDDLYWIFTALDPGAQQTKTMRSNVFAEVIPGGTRLFPPKSVVWPKQGDIDGAPGPIALSVQLWEEDQGNAEATRKTTEQEMSAVGYLPQLTDWAAQAASVVGLAVVGAVEDEVMGAKTFLFQQSRLRKLLKNPGDSYIERFLFGGNTGDLLFEVAGVPDYELFLQVERVT